MLVRSAARSTNSMVFAGTPESAPIARQLMRDLLAGCPRLDDCELVATEFIANAIRHSASGREGGTFVLTIVLCDDRVRIEVNDEGTGDQPGVWYPAPVPRSLPAQAGPDDVVDDGRGLFLVQAIADGTGHHPGEGNSHIAWAELGWYARLARTAER